MSNVTMTAEQLMRAADRLTGAHPGTSAQISDAVNVPVERLRLAYLLVRLGRARGSAERAEVRERMVVSLAQFPHLRRAADRA